jgi:hypothetical protein
LPSDRISKAAAIEPPPLPITTKSHVSSTAHLPFFIRDPACFIQDQSPARRRNSAFHERHNAVLTRTPASRC